MGRLNFRNIVLFCGIALCFSSGLKANGHYSLEDPYLIFNTLTQMEGDTVPPPPEERRGDFISDQNDNPFDLRDPRAIQQSVDYDGRTGQYNITEKIGDDYYRAPTSMTFDQYNDLMAEREQRDYFKELISKTSQVAGEDPVKPYKDNEAIKNGLVDRLFGGSEIDIRPQGNIDITFGADFNRTDNPALPIQMQQQGGFNFDMKIQMNVVGQIGKRLKLTANYNTQQTFDIDNQLKLEFLSDDLIPGGLQNMNAGSTTKAIGDNVKSPYLFTEDAIIKSIEAGNVSMPLRSSLIQGAQNLFGFKTKLQFGRLTSTLLFSQQQSRREEITLQGGAQRNNFSINCDQYDVDRHFFLSHYNRNNYEVGMRNIPQINSLFRITKMEVWVTNDRNVTDNGVRDVVCLSDMGEPDLDKLMNPNAAFPSAIQAKDIYNKNLPDNNANNLYLDVLESRGARKLDDAVSTLTNTFGMQQGRDFFPNRMRKLAPTEYTFHPELGFVSLNISLQADHVIGVAYQYSYNGRTYQVGEFSQDVPIERDTLNVMYVKMLRSVRPMLKTPMWDLMMKNVYSLNAYQVNPEEFNLDIYFQDPGGGDKRFIKLPGVPQIDQVPLLQMMNLDRLNRLNDPQADGQFDFVPGVTILPQNGKVIFPVLEPFGDHLKEKFLDPATGTYHASQAQFVYNQLYDSTVTAAREYPEFNRFIIKGTYKSASSSEISLGAFNIPRGSVQVTAGGQVLVEGRDFTIDYNIGRLKILNDGVMASGLPIKVSYENNLQFNFNVRTMLGSRFDFYINDDINLGATYMHLAERPFTQKVNYGDDPIANNIFGLDFQYSKDAPWLTRLVDKLPLYSTKAPSRITFNAEVAYLLPGHSPAIRVGDDVGGTVYLDDFEGATARFPMHFPASQWMLASVPSDFEEGKLTSDYDYGKNRAKLAWYNIDQTIYGADGITDADRNSQCSRIINQLDIFPNKTIVNTGQNSTFFTLDLAYDPKERGPYNFDFGPSSSSFPYGVIDGTGRLNESKKRWAGIMRSFETNDFEASNIEFLEFWVMSPFHGCGSTNSGFNIDGGELFIDLGNISEDILKDNRRFFENGLPTPGQQIVLDSTAWSRVPRTQAITTAFDNDPNNRVLQDVGFDGVNSTKETDHYTSIANEVRNSTLLNNDAKSKLLADLSSDDFKHYLSEDYAALANPTLNFSKIQQRYFNFSMPEGNSPSNSGGGGFTFANNNNPDTEDLNRDNTLNQEESFYRYRVKFAREGNSDSLDWDEAKFIRTSITKDIGNGQLMHWYQIKIPLDQYQQKFGTISDFRSIRFIRMYVTGWEDPVVLRIGDLAFLRNQWRRYRRPLVAGGVALPPETDEITTFDINPVNLEENSSRLPVQYMLPPGIPRERAIGPFPNAMQNEQSLALTVCNLRDGDSRAIYKNINFDLRVYERIKMSVHAEARPYNDQLNDGDLSCFMRLGSDMEQNYYEYEIPLKFTRSTQGPDYDSLDIWPSENTLNVALDLLRKAKLLRGNSRLNEVVEYTNANSNFADLPAGHKIKLIGNPDLGLVESAMVGIRNPEDGGASHCAEVWVNELRVTGFDERGGFAGLARLDVQMADLANVTMSTSYKSIGWGTIDQRLAQRARESTFTYDFATTVALDKFLPKKWGIKLPFYAQYAKSIITPQFDPYKLDLELPDVLARATNQAERDSLRAQALTETTIESFNFTNVRKERGAKQKKSWPWQIENFSFTYSWARNTRTTPIIQRDVMTLQRGNVDYNFTMQPLFVQPFGKLIKKGKWLQAIKEFNFNPIPNGIQFRSDFTRRYGEVKYRFTGDENANVFVEKQFLWDRTYGLTWDLTRSLKLNFTALNNAVIDEPNGRQSEVPGYDQALWKKLGELGRPKNYRHSVNVTYTLPLKFIPALDWITSKASYQTTFSWSAASLNVDSLGNVLGNTQNRQMDADFNFVNLYNKLGYLKKINTAPSPKPKGGKDAKNSKGKDNKTENLQDAKDGKKDDPNNKEKDGKANKDKNREPSMIERVLIRPLLLVRRMRVNYSEQLSTTIPGYMPRTNYLGQSTANPGAPGWDFAFGYQPNKAWLDNAASKGWMTPSAYLSQQVVQTQNQTFDANMTLEPFKDFKIDLELKKTISRSNTEFFKIENPGETNYQHLNAMETGTMNITYLPISTAFQSRDSSSSRAMFNRFERNRVIISERLGNGQHTNPDDRDEGYRYGYGRTQQDVIIAAFLAAYNGEDPRTAYTGSLTNLLPLPNWRLTYNGLSRIKPFDKWLSSVNITHGYKSSLSVTTFATDVDFRDDPTQLDLRTGSFYSRLEFPTIVINEQFSPLIGIDIRLKNELTAKFEYKKSRTLSMGLLDYQLTETNTEDITLGMGYKIKNMNLFELFSKKKKAKKKPSKPGDPATPEPTKPKEKGALNLGLGNFKPIHDINFKFDFSIQDNRTVNHILDQNTSVPTRGSKTLRISPSIDYVVNNRLTIRAFYDHTFITPAVSSSFPTGTTQGGVTIRFTLAQ